MLTTCNLEILFPSLQVSPSRYSQWRTRRTARSTQSITPSALFPLTVTGVPIETRAVEDQTRGPAAQALRQTAEYYLSFARNDSLQYAHITPAERETVAKEAQSALTWLGERGGNLGFRVVG